jgi:DNA-binding MarR family transcriptional regulator
VPIKPTTLGLPTFEASGVLDDLRRIVRALRESSRAAERRLGVSGAQLFVLRALADVRAAAGEPRTLAGGHASLARPRARLEPEGLSLNALAARTRTHQSTVSVVVKRLVEHGLLTRTTSALDARRVEIRLTRRGRAVLERAPLAAQDKLIAGIERLPRKERVVLAGALRGLVTAMQLDDQPAVMFFEEDDEGLKPTRKKSLRRGLG